MGVVQPLWSPSPERVAASRLGRWLASLGHEAALDPDAAPRLAAYESALAWSVADPGGFWPAVAAEVGTRWATPPAATLAGDGVERARWWPGGRLNYARQALWPAGVADGDVAVVARSRTTGSRQLTWSELRQLVGRVQAGLAAAGVGVGDRVAGVLPAGPEALAAKLATAALGATWTGCAPETGVAGVLDRVAQVEPAVLVAVDGYRWGDREVDRRAEAGEVRAGLPGLRAAVWLHHLRPGADPPAGWVAWADLVARPGSADPVDVDADHPLHVLYSSGTTGKPKAIVHGHAGIAVEHAKVLALHFDVGPGDRLFWYTTTGWMMWDLLVSGLLVGATVVTYDGDPGDLWGVMAETGTAVGGLGAAALVAGARAGLRPGATHDLSALRTLGSTGSPLPGAAAAWATAEVGDDVLVGSFSGGSDVCTGFLGPSPLHPVWAGELSCRCLGAAVGVADEQGRPVVGQEGELVLRAPLPSMPVRFWADADGARLHRAYFERFPGLWAHGDRATLTERASAVISGRSDGTLNRGGVRMGTAEFYDVVEAVDGVDDSLVVHVEDPEGGPGRLWLFVVAPAAAADLPERLAAALRSSLSPRHVPDRVVVVPAVPRTLSGKKLEVPVKRILAGADPAAVVTRASLADPAALDGLLAAAGVAAT